MVSPRGRLAALIFIALSTGLGCAGRSLQKVDTKDLPGDLSKELQDKFEIKDSGAAKPVASGPKTDPAPAAPEAKGAKGKSKRARKGKGDEYADEAKAPGHSPFVWPNRRPAKEPIWVGEKHTFEITYFGMAAGDLDLEVLPHKAINERKVYHVKGNAKSSKVFSLFYTLDDTAESFFDYEGLFSHRFQLELDESKQTRATLELNDSEKKRTFYWNRWNHHVKGYTETKEFGPIDPFSQDSLSALFYVRTLPLTDGATYEFPVVSEGKSWVCVVTVVRREELKTPVGKLRTIVLKPETKYQGVLQKKGDSFLWVTDDDRRFVVRLEAKVRIGTVVAALKKLEKGAPPEEPVAAVAKQE